MARPPELQYRALSIAALLPFGSDDDWDDSSALQCGRSSQANCGSLCDRRLAQTTRSLLR